MIIRNEFLNFLVGAAYFNPLADHWLAFYLVSKHLPADHYDAMGVLLMGGEL